MAETSSDSNSVNVKATPSFSNELRKLKKRYRNIRRDIEPVIEELKQGKRSGVQIAGTDYAVFKVRIRNRDIKKGKSGGYRLIYQLKSDTDILILTIYSKSDVGSVTAQSLKQIIIDYERSRD